MGKYTQGQAKIPGAEKFYSQNATNQKYINELTVKGSGAAYGGNSRMHLAISSDASRLYRYDPETKSLVRDFYNEAFDKIYETVPELHYRYIDTKNLSEINNGTYIYFEAGSSVPTDVFKGSPIDDATYGGNADFKAAVEALKNERAAMDPRKQKAEILRHNAQMNQYDYKRSKYINQETLGSSVRNIGSDECRDFAQNINNNLAVEHPEIDLEYKINSKSLSENDMVAMTYLSFGNPEVMKDAKEAMTPEISAFSALKILPNDFLIERSGKTGVALAPLIAARQDAKGKIEAYDACGDINILAKSVVSGIFACGIVANHVRYLDAEGVGALISASIIKDFLRKPGLVEAARHEAQLQGKLDKLNDGLKYIEGHARIYDFCNERNNIELKLANLIDGRIDDISPQEREKEISRLEDELSVSNTITALIEHFENSDNNLFIKYTSDLQKSINEQIDAARSKIESDTSITPSERGIRMLKVVEAITRGSNYAVASEPISAIENLMQSSGGAQLLRDVIKRSGLRGKSAEIMRELSSALEKSGIIPARPKELSQKAVDEYRKALKNFDADLAISRYNVSKMFAKTDELVSVQRQHEEVGKDLLESSISSMPDKDELKIDDTAHKSEYEEIFGMGSKYLKGLFALKTDSSDMFYAVNEEKEAEQLRAWQKDIDAVEIPHSNLFSDKLIEMSVLGKCLTDEYLFKSQDIAQGFGSTLAKGLALRCNLETFIFDNMVNSDRRFNTHFIRSVVADARREIKDAVLNDSADVIKESLRSAVQSCLSDCLPTTDITLPHFVFAAERIKDIDGELKKSGMSLSDLGLSELEQKQCEMINAKLQLASRYLKNQDYIKSHYELSKSSQGMSELTNPATNPKLYEAMTECMAIDRIMSQLKCEVQSLMSPIDIFSDQSSKLWHTRELTPMETLLGHDPSELIDYYKERINDNVHYKAFKNAKSNEELSKFVLRGGLSDERYEIKASSAVFFEEKLASSVIDKLKEQLPIGIEEMKASSYFNKGYVLNRLQACLGLLGKIENERANIKDFSSVENLNKLRPLYEEFSKNRNEILEMMGRTGDPFPWHDENSRMLSSIDDQAREIKKYQASIEQNKTIQYDFQSSRKLPNAISNLQDSIKLVDELSAGKAESKKFTDFKEHLTELSTMLGASFGKDVSISEKITSSLVGEKYAQLISDITAMEAQKNNGLSDKLKYVISGIKTSLSREYINEIQPLEKSSGSFKNAYVNNIKENPGANLVREKNELKSALQRLDAVATRVGGNSAEFQAMLDDAKALQASTDDNEAFRKASEKLSVSVNNYIKAKKTAPSTEKGRIRLGIAKELKDISRSLSRDLSSEIAKNTRESYISKAHTITDKLKEKTQIVVANIAAAWKEKDAKLILNNVSALVYLNGVEKNAETLGEKRLADMISPERINSSVKQLNKLSANVIKSFDVAGFDNAIKEGKLASYIIKNYDKLGQREAIKLKAAEAAQKVADRADAILARQNRPATVGGISL